MIVYIVVCDLEGGADIAAVCTRPDLAADVCRRHAEAHPCVVLEFEADALPAGAAVRHQRRG